MIFIGDKSKCCGCSACYNICPQKAISMDEDYEGFQYPVINQSKCIDCGLCHTVCPYINSISNENSKKKTVIAAYNKNLEERLLSSSGGIFVLLAKQVLLQKGVVVGASFDLNCELIHVCIENSEDIYKLMGSKYVQSCISDTYKKIKHYLSENRKVLFCGTPCQIAGLRNFLKKNPDGLLCVDIVCHGVPSRLVWRKYNNYISRYTSIKKVNFRNKKYGWKKYYFSIEYYNKKDLMEFAKKNIYMRGFLQNLYLRPSCYSCKFKGQSILSDITLGDFWGIGKIAPKLDDDNGTSAIVINNDKGMKAWDSISASCKFKIVDYDILVKYNAAIEKSASLNSARKDFFSNINTHKNIVDYIARYTNNESLFKILKRIFSIK